MSSSPEDSRLLESHVDRGHVEFRGESANCDAIEREREMISSNEKRIGKFFPKWWMEMENERYASM